MANWYDLPTRAEMEARDAAYVPQGGTLDIAHMRDTADATQGIRDFAAQMQQAGYVPGQDAPDGAKWIPSYTRSDSLTGPQQSLSGGSWKLPSGKYLTFSLPSAGSGEGDTAVGPSHGGYDIYDPDQPGFFSQLATGFAPIAAILAPAVGAAFAGAAAGAAESAAGAAESVAGDAVSGLPSYAYSGGAGTFAAESSIPSWSSLAEKFGTSALKNAAIQLVTTGKIDPKSVLTGSAVGTVVSAGLGTQDWYNSLPGPAKAAISSALSSGGTQLMTTGRIDPTKLAVSGAAGAVGSAVGGATGSDTAGQVAGAVTGIIGSQLTGSKTPVIMPTTTPPATTVTTTPSTSSNVNDWLTSQGTNSQYGHVGFADVSLIKKIGEQDGR